MFAVDIEIFEIIGEPARILPYQDKSLNDKVKNDAQGQKLLTMKNPCAKKTVQPHGRFNVSQGVITSSSLKEYSEEQIVEGLTDQGVSKVYRNKRKTDQANLIPTNSLILTFLTHLYHQTKFVYGLDILKECASIYTSSSTMFVTTR